MISNQRQWTRSSSAVRRERANYETAPPRWILLQCPVRVLEHRRGTFDGHFRPRVPEVSHVSPASPCSIIANTIRCWRRRPCVPVASRIYGLAVKIDSRDRGFLSNRWRSHRWFLWKIAPWRSFPLAAAIYSNVIETRELIISREREREREREFFCIEINSLYKLRFYAKNRVNKKILESRKYLSVEGFYRMWYFEISLVW